MDFHRIPRLTSAHPQDLSGSYTAFAWLRLAAYIVTGFGWVMVVAGGMSAGSAWLDAGQSRTPSPYLTFPILVPLVCGCLSVVGGLTFILLSGAVRVLIAIEEHLRLKA